MAFPSDWTLVTVTGTFCDYSGAPETGTVTFTPTPFPVEDPANSITVIPSPIVCTLDGAGHFSHAIPASNMPVVSPFGWAYTVAYSFNNGAFTDSFLAIIDHALGSVDITALAPVVTPPLPVGVVTSAALTAAIAGANARASALALVFGR